MEGSRRFCEQVLAEFREEGHEDGSADDAAAGGIDDGHIAGSDGIEDSGYAVS